MESPASRESKECSVCHETKQFTFFYPDSRICKRCSSLRMQSKRNKQPKVDYPTVTEKRCSNCKIVKVAIAFTRSRRDKSGLGSLCRECASIRNHARMYGEAGLQLLNTRANCAICGIYVEKKMKCIDHDHVTGKLRDILCLKCNMGLGAFGDDLQLLNKASEYIRLHKLQEAI